MIAFVSLIGRRLYRFNFAPVELIKVSLFIDLNNEIKIINNQYRGFYKDSLIFWELEQPFSIASQLLCKICD